MFEFSVDMGS